jgi:hypothetical protein
MMYSVKGNGKPNGGNEMKIGDKINHPYYGEITVVSVDASTEYDALSGEFYAVEVYKFSNGITASREEVEKTWTY